MAHGKGKLRRQGSHPSLVGTGTARDLSVQWLREREEEIEKASTIVQFM
jgi:hypothetical protein